MKLPAVRKAPIALWLLLSCSGLVAHELDENRITVALQGQHSLHVVLRLDFAGLLQHLMAPDADPAEFLAVLAAQGPEQLEAGMKQLKEQVEQGLAFRNSGQLLTLSRWEWPTGTAVHAVLRERLIGSLLQTTDLAEDPSLEVHVVASDMFPINRLTIETPELVKPAVVVWYRPQQAVINPNSPIQVLEF